MVSRVGSGTSAFMNTSGDRLPSVGMSRLDAHNNRSSPPHAIGTPGVTDCSYPQDHAAPSTTTNPLPGVNQNARWFQGRGAASRDSNRRDIERPTYSGIPEEGTAQADLILPESKEEPEDLGYDTVQQERVKKLRAFFEDPDSSGGAKAMSLVILGLICVSTVALIIETIPTFDNEDDKKNFFIVESICIALFTIEYVLRLVLAEKKGKFVQNGMNIIDLISIVPFYVDLCIWAGTGTPPYSSSGGTSDLTRVLRLFRLIRVFRVFRLGKNSRSLLIAFRSVMASRDTLGLMVFIMFIMLVLFGAFVYNFEVGEWESSCSVPGEDPAEGCYKVEDDLGIESVSKFISVPESMWWCVVTVMTVGYGDLYPLTPLGKICACFCMVSSIVILALPISVIGINFSAMYTHDENCTNMKQEPMKLYQCGEQLDADLAKFLATSRFYLNRLANVQESIRRKSEKITADLEAEDTPTVGVEHSTCQGSENAGNNLLALKIDEVRMQATYERVMSFMPLRRLEPDEGPQRNEADIGVKRSLLRTRLNGEMILDLVKEVKLMEEELKAMKMFVSCEDLPTPAEGEEVS